ncbi:MAG: T9SS type A sorting domain-containing protein, partial [Candidatus Neomarinimicrobiota bacterium]
STDPDGDPVTYMFLFSDSADFSMEYGPLSVTGISVAFEDIVASIREQQITVATFWWSIVAMAGGDTIDATDGPYQVTFDTRTLAVADQSALPEFFVLHQNYPNPFNPITTLKYELPAYTRVLLVIYDMRGREVTRLVDGYMGAGFNRVVWNSSDAAGRPVPSGIYIARLITPEYTRTVKMTLLK